MNAMARLSIVRAAGVPLLAAICAATLAGPAAGFPTVNLTWDGCGTTRPINATLVPGGSLAATAWVTNQGVISQGYQLYVRISAPGPALPDAWRFDANGCEPSGAFVIETLNPGDASCPALAGSIPSLQMVKFDYDPSSGTATVALGNSYANGGAGNPASGDPGTTYFLARFRFDFSSAVAGPGDPASGTCGGADVPVCLHLYSADFVNLQGTLVDWVMGQNFLLVNDPLNDQHCPGMLVPTAPRTWGSIKSQYRD